MPRKPEKSWFVAPPLRIEPQGGGPDHFGQTLVGFCVTGQLDQQPMARAWWADRLGVSRSHMTKMVVEPSVPFLEQLDFVLSDVGSSQRLPPRLLEFYSDNCPEERAFNSQPVIEWMARNPEVLSRGPVSDYLLHSEVAVMRCHLRDRYDMENDPTVTKSIDELLTLASGPYGGSNLAHQRCAELGLLVPETFFDALTRHFDTSPVGFRLLRTLDRFVRIQRRQEADPAIFRPGRTRTDYRIAALLTRLEQVWSRARYLDPYPGAEWGISLTRDVLRGGRVSMLARSWLTTATESEGGSDRERLYAAWVAISTAPHPHRTSRIADSLKSSPSALLERWGELFGNLDHLRSQSEEDRRETILDYFPVERDRVAKAMAEHCGAEELSGVRDALESVILAALITPDGRYRRSLIEAIVAAGLVTPTSNVLVDICGSEDIPDGIRESIIFFLSRLRQPTGEVIEVLSNAIDEDTCPNVAHAALWGMGDIFRDSVPQPDKIRDLLERAITSPKANFSARHQVAAAHALAVMAKSLPDDKGVAATLRHVRDSPATRSLSANMVVALCSWGLNMHDQKDEIIDPTRLGVEGLLERNISEEGNLGLKNDPVGASYR